MVAEVFQNRAPRSGDDFEKTRDFFMSQNPGEIGSMFGGNGKILLPAAVFLDNIVVGFEEDAQALRYVYESMIMLTDCKDVMVGYSRFGYPFAKFKGDAFPNAGVLLDLSFLKQYASIVSGGVINSDFILLRRYSEGQLKDLIGEERVEVDAEGFFVGSERNHGVAEQVSFYPDLAQALNDHSWRLDDAVATRVGDEVSGWKEGWSVFVDYPPSYEVQRVLDHYGLFRYKHELGRSTQTLNEVVAEVESALPLIQGLHAKTRQVFPLPVSA